MVFMCKNESQLKRVESLPVVSTRANSIFEMMKTIDIPGDDLPVDDLTNELCCSMTVGTNAKVLEDMNSCARGRADQPIGNGQPLTMMANSIFLLSLVHIMHHRPCVRNVAFHLHRMG